MQIEVLEEANPPGAEDVTAGLRAHVIEKTGALPFIPLTLLLRDDDDRVRGGIRGQIALGWLQVDHFWVDEALRGQGYGARLLDMAEEAARMHGAIGAQLTTSTFQAEEFYRKQGYAEIARPVTTGSGWRSAGADVRENLRISRRTLRTLPESTAAAF